MPNQDPMNEKKEWQKKRDQILGDFNLNQVPLLTQNGHVTLTPQQQRKEGEYNCRDAQIAVDATAKWFEQEIIAAEKRAYEKGYAKGELMMQYLDNEQKPFDESAIREDERRRTIRGAIGAVNEFLKKTAAYECMDNIDCDACYNIRSHNYDIQGLLGTLLPPTK